MCRNYLREPSDLPELSRSLGWIDPVALSYHTLAHTTRQSAELTTTSAEADGGREQHTPHTHTHTTRPLSIISTEYERVSSV